MSKPEAVATNRPISDDFICLSPGVHTVRIRAEAERPEHLWRTMRTWGPVRHRGFERVAERDGFQLSTRLGRDSRRSVWVEGRASDFLGASGDLSPITDFAQLGQATLGLAAEWGIELAPGSISVARWDLAVDVRFKEPAVALAFMHTVASFNLPQCRAVPIRAVGSATVETAQWRNREGIVMRIYDVNARRGPNPFLPRMRRVRFERQVRLRRSDQVAPKDFEPHEIGRPLLHSIEHWLASDAIPAWEFPATYMLIKKRLGQSGLDGSGPPLNERRARYLIGAAADLLFEGVAAWRDPKAAQVYSRTLQRHGIEIARGPWRFDPSDVLTEVALAVASDV